MPDNDTERNEEVAELDLGDTPALSLKEATDTLGEIGVLVSRRGERFVVTKHNNPFLAVVSLEDLARLIELDRQEAAA